MPKVPFVSGSRSNTLSSLASAATPLPCRRSTARVVSTETGSMSRARMRDAPSRAAAAACSPEPQPMSRKVAPAHAGRHPAAAQARGRLGQPLLVDQFGVARPVVAEGEMASEVAQRRRGLRLGRSSKTPNRHGVHQAFAIVARVEADRTG